MKKEIWQYGLSMGILILILQVIHYQAFIKNLPIELFGLVIGVIFLIVGIWAGVNWKKKPWRWSLKSKKSGLSDREREVLVLLAAGYANKEIADRLFVSLNTVKTHISNIYLKLNVKRRTQAIQKAREEGLIEFGSL